MGRSFLLIIGLLLAIPASAQQQPEQRICYVVSSEPGAFSGSGGITACCPLGYELVIDVVRKYRCALTREMTNLDGLPIPRVTRR